MTAAERAEWRKIVTPLPPGWIVPENACMLVQLCRHIVLARNTAKSMQAIRKMFTDQGRDVLTDVEYIERIGPLLTRHGHETDRIARLCTKLKLSQLSRYSRSDAAGAARRETGTPSEVQPWDDWGQRDDPSKRN